MSEQEIQRQILDALALMPGVFAWRQNTGVASVRGFRVRYGKNGSGDISGILSGGRRLELEVKSKTGVVSDEQREFGARINAMGGLWAVVRSLDEALAVVREALEKVSS